MFFDISGLGDSRAPQSFICPEEKNTFLKNSISQVFAEAKEIFFNLQTVAKDSLYENYFESSSAFKEALQNWVDEAPSEEKAGRQTAMRRILHCVRYNDESLSLSGLGLSSLPPIIGDVDYIEPLARLGLQGCQLKSLDLSNNRLNDLPDSIAYLTGLKHIDLSCNNFRTLPESFFDLKDLSTIILKDNYFQEVPVGFKNFVLLERLNFSGNHLRAVPKWLSKCTFLRHLDVSDNFVFGLVQQEKFLELTELKTEKEEKRSLLNTIFSTIFS